MKPKLCQDLDMMMYAVNGTCRDSIRIGSPHDDKICGYGSMFDFVENETVEKFEVSNSLLNENVKNRNVFDWMTVGVRENKIDLFIQRYKN